MRLQRALVHGEDAGALAREEIEEPQQVLLVQQPESQLHDRLVELQLSRVELGGEGIGLLRADLVVHAEEIGLLVGRRAARRAS